MNNPPKTPNETKEKYASRCSRWQAWARQEPLVDLCCVSETEVSEYRTWAGTKAFHDQMVQELMEIANA